MSTRLGIAAAHVTLTLAVGAGEEPPTEFRIFTAGQVETKKGNFIFDDKAAASVMAAYQKHGIDLMIDYDHASIGSHEAPDPAQAGKAAGWCNLELREGELWAVNVRWTEPAADALRRKEWRFMSPAFETHGERIVSILNVAITNLPATRRLEPLVAANLISASGGALDPKLIASALDALIAGDADKCMEILKGLVASAAAGDPDKTTEDAPPPVGDGGADESTEASDAPPPDPAKEDKTEVAAASARLLRLTSANTFTAAVEVVETYRASHIELETERQKLAVERATLEAAERRKGCVELVTLAGYAPAAVWADATATAPKKYLLAMPIADFREFVADALAAKGAKRTPVSSATTPPPSAGPAGDLTPEQLEICKETGCDPSVFATLKRARS